MKKLVLAVAALGLISLTSCKKDRTCKCTSSTINQDYPLLKSTKKDATTACDALNTQWTLLSGKCELK
jgi:hypothetical protein